MFNQSPKSIAILMAAAISAAVVADGLGIGPLLGGSFTLGTTTLIAYFAVSSFLVRILFLNGAAPRWFAIGFAAISCLGWFVFCEAMDWKGHASLLLLFATFSSYRMLRMNEPLPPPALEAPPPIPNTSPVVHADTKTQVTSTLEPRIFAAFMVKGATLLQNSETKDFQSWSNEILKGAEPLRGFTAQLYEASRAYLEITSITCSAPSQELFDRLFLARPDSLNG